MPMVSCSDDDSSAKPQEVPLISKLTLETANAPDMTVNLEYWKIQVKCDAAIEFRD